MSGRRFGTFSILTLMVLGVSAWLLSHSYFCGVYRMGAKTIGICSSLGKIYIVRTEMPPLDDIQYGAVFNDQREAGHHPFDSYAPDNASWRWLGFGAERYEVLHRDRRGPWRVDFAWHVAIPWWFVTLLLLSLSLWLNRRRMHTGGGFPVVSTSGDDDNTHTS